ncbi:MULTISPECIES: 3-isopropylmalate dehydratase large subunit [unclassified Streptomyces]|uniref:3-isopropylmalate dehydratase large subunit n=1 Tax=unclassified Streptomyces TaxID=2593676 RepID=UPI0006F6C61A|nr:MULTISPECIES: 3-isopropylmalate dehydratase large subunit [unclassified Streptomyces]KQX57957.1 isopropylmalate isomerase [Streptomyces sp. Root1304]KRA78841.1 isopropylmalate isomerase [Streptomyces sp. Root66D1]
MSTITQPERTERNLIEKVWENHVVDRAPGEPDLLYIDLHLLHEASSPQAFDGLQLTGRRVRRPDLALALEDHNVPTNTLFVKDAMGSAQLERLRENCEEQGIELFSLGDDRQGIVHVVAPELGFVRPGMTVVCGDSHTSTHGAFGALAFGVGTSDVEHVLATQTLALQRPRTMSVEFVGEPPADVTPKDLILALIAHIGANGANGYAIEYRGKAVENLSMEGRMTVCNMSIEAGARAGLIAPDDKTVDYLRERWDPAADAEWEEARAYWESLRTDEGAAFDRVVELDVTGLKPFVTWGTNPGQAVPLDAEVPAPESFASDAEQAAARRALEYMGLEAHVPMRDIDINTVFLGSCTNGRIEDLRAAADVLRGRKVAPSITMLVVPGSMAVRAQAEEEGLHQVFLDAGAQWRLSGCSMCMGINADRLQGIQRVASTSNRNYEGRQGTHARTHLVSPVVAAATAVVGRLATPSELTDPKNEQEDQA